MDESRKINNQKEKKNLDFVGVSYIVVLEDEGNNTSIEQLQH